MIRVLLTVALSVALLGIALPPAELAERDRNAAVATGELEAIADRADRLADRNDPVERGRTPASTTMLVAPPTLTDGGRLRIDDDRLVWEPETGPPRRVVADVALRVEAPLVLEERTRLRLSLVAGDDERDSDDRDGERDGDDRDDERDSDDRDDERDREPVVRIERLSAVVDDRVEEAVDGGGTPTSSGER